MKIDSQVCTWIQGMRLSELGIRWDEKTLFVYLMNRKGESTIEREGYFSFNADDHLSPAFTVAELWQMLPTLGLSVTKSNDGKGRDFYWGECVKRKFQAYNLTELLADVLICLLDKGTVTADECSKLLAEF